MDRLSRKIALAVVIILAMALAGVWLVACGSDGGSDDGASAEAGVPFKIGVAGPMTGQYATYGTSHKAGAEIAMEELNAAGGVNGGEVSIAIGDDLGDPKEAVLVAQKFIDDSEIVAVDGHQFSGATIAAAGKYQPAGLTMVTPSATQPDITDMGDFIWRICMTDAVQVITGCSLGHRSLKFIDYGKFAATFVNQDTGLAVRATIKESFDSNRPIEELSRAVANLPDDELVILREVAVDIPADDLPGFPQHKAYCSLCGERISDGRDVTRNGKTLCRACANGKYYQEKQ